MFADYHVHSHFSEDTDFPMELEIQKAIKLGMDELCFTEHSDYDVPTVVNCDYDAYFEEMEKMKDKYKGQITLKTGIEFGIQTHTTKAYEETFRQYPFDFVVLDTAFSRSLQRSDQRKQLLQVLLSLAQTHKYRLVAAVAENDESRAYLTQLGCCYFADSSPVCENQSGLFQQLA
jgi:HisJ family histidinol phosphate phosphatase